MALETRLLRVALVEQDGAPQDLHDVDARFFSQALGHLEARFRTLLPQLHLDEFVVKKRPRHLGHDRLIGSAFANLNDGLQGMAVAAQQAAQRRGRHERLLAWAGRGGHGRKLPHRTVQVTPECDVEQPDDVFLRVFLGAYTFPGARLDFLWRCRDNRRQRRPGNDDRGTADKRRADRCRRPACKLMIGTNDIPWNYDLANEPTRLGNLIDQITADAPKALVVVAQIGPSNDDARTALIKAYNDGIPAVVQARVAAGKHVAMVDMFTPFVSNPNYKTALLSDEVHPNPAGYVILGQY